MSMKKFKIEELNKIFDDYEQLLSQFKKFQFNELQKVYKFYLQKFNSNPLKKLFNRKLTFEQFLFNNFTYVELEYNECCIYNDASYWGVHYWPGLCCIFPFTSLWCIQKWKYKFPIVDKFLNICNSKFTHVYSQIKYYQTLLEYAEEDYEVNKELISLLENIKSITKQINEVLNYA